MRSVITAAVCALAAIASGCSTLSDLAGVQRPGYQADGSYVLGPEEMAYTCKQIDLRLAELERENRNLPAMAQEELEKVPRTVQALFQRATADKPEDSTHAMQSHRHNESEAAALRIRRSQKACDAPALIQNS